MSRTVAVAGAGRMGIGIAQVFAYAGYPVRLIDVKERLPEETEQVLCKAAAEMEKNLGALAACGILHADTADTILRRVEYVGRSAMDQVLADAVVVFEAVPEVMDVKRVHLERISAAVSPDTLIASTTSTFLVDELARFVREPERFMNTHWLNPAYLIPLVEVSPGRQTLSAQVRNMLCLLEDAGKVPVVCAASPGFIVPRIQALAMNEAARLIEEGIASAEDVDKACRVGFGLRFAVLGLLEFIDWGGGDILYYASNYLKDSLGSDRFAAPEIITENMKQGRTGMKTGMGFYDFGKMDVKAYQQQTIAKFVDLLQHLGLLPPPRSADRRIDSGAAESR